MAEMPLHTLAVSGTDANAASPVPGNQIPAAAGNLYGPPVNLIAIHSGTVGSAGGSQQHNNMQGFLTLSFCVALQGVYPPRP